MLRLIVISLLLSGCMSPAQREEWASYCRTYNNCIPDYQYKARRYGDVIILERVFK